MDRTLILLLAALALVYLAWLSAKRQTAAVRQRQQEQVERNSCTLEPRETAAGQGFAVVDSEGRTRSAEELRWSEHGLQVLDLQPFRPGPDAGGADGFTPGLNVELIDGDESPEPLLWVWDSSMTMRAGAIPPQHAASVRQRLDAGEVRECVVVWEQITGAERSGLHVLLVHRDVDLDA